MVRPLRKISTIKLLFLLMVYFLFSGCASKRSVLDSQMFSGAPVPSTFFVGLDLSAKLKYASLDGADSEVFKGASLMGAALGSEVVIGWPKFFIGGGADYSKLYQLQSASDLDDMNASGTMFTTYGLAGFYLYKMRWVFRYFLASTYTFDQKTLGGKDFELSAPESSFGLDITYGSLSFEFNSLQYGEYTLGDAQREFGSSNRPKVMTYGVVYAIHF